MKGVAILIILILFIFLVGYIIEFAKITISNAKEIKAPKFKYLVDFKNRTIHKINCDYITKEDRNKMMPMTLSGVMKIQNRAQSFTTCNKCFSKKTRK